MAKGLMDMKFLFGVIICSKIDRGDGYSVNMLKPLNYAL